MPAALQPLAFPLADLRPDPHNARQHSTRNLAAIRASLSRFGWRNVVVARKKDRVVLAGNARVESAKALGWKTAPVLFVDDDKARAMAFAIADNRTAELAEWNLEELAGQLSKLDGDLLEVVGFTSSELDNLLAADWEIGNKASTDDDAIESHAREPKKPKDDASRTTLVLSQVQLKALLDALDVARKRQPTLTVGAFVEQLAGAFVAGASPALVPAKKGKRSK